MLNFFRKNLSYIRFVLNRIKRFFNQIFLFYIPNNLKFRITKIQFLGELPIVNQKTFITGKGKVIIGDKCNFGYKPGGFHYCGAIEFQARQVNSTIKIGNNIATNNNIFICAANSISIGDNCLIGQNITIMDFEAHGLHPKQRRTIGSIGKVVIKENVWIGNNVIILKNSVIGVNCIIAAGAVVSGKFPDNVIIGGVPAKIIKKIDV